MKAHHILKGLLAVSLIPLLFIESCAPVFSDLQSARLVGDGNIEVTPSYSSVSWAEDGESQKVQNHYGAQAGFGLSETMDLRTRIEYVSVKSEGSDDKLTATVVGIGPKFSIVKDRVAGYIPLGTAFGSDIQTSQSWELQPTLLFTFPVNEQFEVNPSVKYIMQLADDTDNMVAINLGLGIGEYGKFVIRPEYGLLYNPGESGHFSHFSIGLNVFPKWE